MKTAIDLKKILPFLPGQSSKSSTLDETLVYFVTFLFSLSTAEISPSNLLKTAGSVGYGIYSKTVMEIHNLGLRWQYGIATAAGIVASQVPNEEFKLFLMKLEQVIRLGDSLRDFLKSEMAAVVNAYASAYERSMESLKLLLGMFSTLMSTASFMIAAMMIMSMIGGGDSSTIIVVAFATIAGLGAFALMMYMIFPKDKLMNENGEHLKQFKKIFLPSVGASVAIGIALLFVPQVSREIIVSAVGGPLIFPGFVAKRVEGRIKKLDESFPSFIRHLTEIYATVGSLGQALKTVMKSDFGGLSTHARSMLNRVLNRVTMEQAFELFSTDTGNELITASNKVISISMIKGANMIEVGETLAQLTSRFNDLRKKRQQVSKAFETTVLILHVLTVAVMSFMKGVFQFFADIFGHLDKSLGASVIQPIPPDMMNIVLPLMIVALACINGLVIKISQGGLYKTMWFNIGLLLVIGGVVSFGVQQFVGQMFGDIIGSNPFGDLATQAP
ncbi:type II secretion system F family protein [Nitrososphaera viennensis]|uniref:Type II secretion system F family protein n=2 Tax=Nitrososphaera viennensis TaxID=1034015 RepID=A0A977IFK8_9ARCH|nr:type II secretion system F family protein [Nitrososphaera viennensis]AIC15226.1 putative archaeal flagella assembly protein J [Nitrososphaera viennensis EN76]UVS70141.1 type II secretion system F family protein [Nitrososphaera viennensis]